MKVHIRQCCVVAAAALALAPCFGRAMMTSSPKPPTGRTVFSVHAVSENEEPVYGYNGSRVSTRVNVVFRLDDGSRISAYCEGNAFSGVFEPTGWVCRGLEVGGAYKAWWRNGGQIYVQGQDSGGKDLATLFTVTGRSSP